MARSAARPPDPASPHGERAIAAAVVTDRPLLAEAFGAVLRERGVDVQPIAWALADVVASRRRRPDCLVVLTSAATVDDDAAALRSLLEREPTAAIAVVILDDVEACGPALLAAGCTVVVPPSAPRSTLVSAVEAARSHERMVHPEVLAAALGGLRSEPSRGVRHLTRRELDVLRLIAAGRTNAAIGGELGVAASTVKTHVASLLDKLDAHDRAHAVAIAMRAGAVR